MWKWIGLVCVAMGLGVVGCGSSDERSSTPPATPQARPAAPQTPPAAGVRVTGIELGRTVNPDKTVHDVSLMFKSGDTVYASVKVEGDAANLPVAGRFTGADGKVVDESTQQLTVTKEAVTEFHAAKPGGWSAGRYNFEVQLDGRPAGTKSFEVEP